MNLLRAAFVAVVVFGVDQSIQGQAPNILTYAEAVALFKTEAAAGPQLVETADYLTNVSGPRLTGSANLTTAGDFVIDRLKRSGIENARLESWGPFSPGGWTNDRFVALALKPQPFTLIGYPSAWTIGTNGAVISEAVHIAVNSEADFDKYTGTLAGKFVLTQPPRDVAARFSPLSRRYTDAELAEFERPQGPPQVPEAAALQQARAAQARIAFRLGPLRKFLADERVAAVIDPSVGDGGTVFVGGGRSRAPAQAMLAIEHYNRLVRLLDRKIPVTLEVDIQNRFLPEVTTSFNVVADLIGTDKSSEVVMIGAHLDSWHAGTGATDNAAGVAALMEAMRILKATRVPLRRTVRLALWTGEEQGELGSSAYVREHFADPRTMVLKSEHGRLSVYFNLDAGTGAIRGISSHGNAEVVPLFRTWMEPFRDAGVSTVAKRGFGLSDDYSFDEVGLPSFDFIQDPIDYDTRTNHTNMDVYERVLPKDLAHNAVVVAAFVYQAANLESLLPRKALPKPTAAP